jgi:aquaglyceroporin related protein, other eukaryote
MCASAVVYGNYKSAIDAFEGGANIRTVPGYSETATAGIFCTYPAPFMTRTGMFFSEFVASTILMFMIYALKDDGNIGAGPLVPLGLFFVIFGIGACFGWETGQSFFFSLCFTHFYLLTRPVFLVPVEGSAEADIL